MVGSLGFASLLFGNFCSIMLLEPDVSGLLHESWQLLMSAPIRMAAATQQLRLQYCPAGYITHFYAFLCSMFAGMNFPCCIALPEPILMTKFLIPGITVSQEM